MGSTDTTNALSRTAVTIEEDMMSWDEFYKELKPSIPFDKAKTVKQIIEESGETSDTYVREMLEKKVEQEGWHKQRYKSSNYYWPPD